MMIKRIIEITMIRPWRLSQEYESELDAFLGSITKHVLDCGEGKGEALQGLDTMDDGEGD